MRPDQIEQIGMGSLAATREVLNRHLANLDIHTYTDNGHSHVVGPIAVDPVFTRLSDAYDEVLKKYTTGQRRWNANGTLIEEGTTNLLPAGNENFLSPWAGISDETVTVTDYPINIPGVGYVIAKRIKGTGDGTSLVKYQRQLSGLINPHTHTISVWAMLLSGNAAISSSGTDVAITSTMQRLTATRTIGATTTNFQFRVAATTDVLDVVAYAPQIEDKPYATSYFPPGGGARAAESLTVPATVMNAAAGTIELDYVFNPNITSPGIIFSTGSTTGKRLQLYVLTAGTLSVVFGNGTSNVTISKTGNLVSGTKYRIAVRYTSAGLQLFVDGVLAASSASAVVPFPETAFTFSIGNLGGVLQINSYLANLRISKIARSDAEMAYTGTLSVDANTTFFSPMKESISSRPYIIENGQAAQLATISQTVIPGNVNSAPSENAVINKLNSYPSNSHGHVTGPLAVDPEYTRLSDAYDDVLRRWEYNQRPWNSNGTYVREATTNLLPAGAENFGTGWLNGADETCTVTDYPTTIPGIGAVVAKRIQGNGLGTSATFIRYHCQKGGLTNPNTCVASIWAINLNPAVTARIGTASSASNVTIPSAWARIASIASAVTQTTNYLAIRGTVTGDVIDIAVYQPQLEEKLYATSYTTPGTTRAAETFAIPVGATQKNLLTLNQATGGDTLGDTTGFTAVVTVIQKAIAFSGSATNSDFNFSVRLDDIDGAGQPTSFFNTGGVSTKTAVQYATEFADWLNSNYSSYILALVSGGTLQVIRKTNTGTSALAFVVSTLPTGITAANSTAELRISRTTAEKWNGTGSIKVVTPGAMAGEGVSFTLSTFNTSKIYTMTFYAKGTGTINVPAKAGIALTNEWVRYSTTFVPPNSTYSPYLVTSTQQAATFWIDGLQIEEGTTASDWTTPAVDYSMALIDPAQPFTFRTRVNLGATYLGTIRDIFDANNNGSEAQRIAFYLTGTSLALTIVGTTTRTWTATVGELTGSHNFGFTYNVNESVPELWADGVKLSTTLSGAAGTMPTVLTIIGLGYRPWNKAVQLNGYISNVEIAKIKRTDTEMAYTGTLLPDEYTTYYSDCKESISTRPYCKDSQGNAVPVMTGDMVHNQNIILNGDFRLATRGTSFNNLLSGVYALDGWHLNYDGTGHTFNISQQAFTQGQQEVPGAEYFMRLNQTVAPTGQTSFAIRQRIENVHSLNGMKCKLSFYARSLQGLKMPTLYISQVFGTSGAATVYPLGATNVQIGTKMQKYTFEFMMPSTAGKTLGTGPMLYVYFFMPVNSVFQFDLADVEIKPASAPDVFYRRELVEEQRRMSRFLQIIPAKKCILPHISTANYFQFYIEYPVEMRGNGTLTMGTEGTDWQVYSATGFGQTGFTMTQEGATSRGTYLTLAKTGHGLSGAYLYIINNRLVSAEL